jgi:hypothetical protein
MMKNCNKYLILCCIIYIIVIIKSLSLNDYISYFTIPYFFIIFVIVLILSLIKNIKITGLIYMILSLLCIIYVLCSLVQDFHFIAFMNFMIVIILSILTKIAIQKFNISIGFWGLFFNFVQLCLCIHFFLIK